MLLAGRSAFRCFHRSLLVGLPGLLVPAATEGLVQVDLADQLREPVVDQRLLRTEQVALGIEEGQVAVDPDAVAALGQAVVVPVGGHQVALGLQLLLEGLACGQAIGDFRKAVWMVFSYLATLMSFWIFE